MVFEKLREILCKELELTEDQVTLDSDIMEDLNADSLDLVEIVMSIEDEFMVEVPDEAIEGTILVSDVVKFIEENQ